MVQHPPSLFASFPLPGCPSPPGHALLDLRVQSKCHLAWVSSGHLPLLPINHCNAAAYLPQTEFASRSRACIWLGLGCSERSVAGAPGRGFRPALPHVSPSTPACSPHGAGVGWGQKLPTGDAQKCGGLASRGSRSGRTLCPLHRPPLARPLREGPCHTVVCVYLPHLERLPGSPRL